MQNDVNELQRFSCYRFLVVVTQGGVQALDVRGGELREQNVTDPGCDVLTNRTIVRGVSAGTAIRLYRFRQPAL